ncbi:MAG TPA: TonB-dependent receptor [Thermoanaerobaculia bacterium]|jgi:outer membrane receptor protein involved in Fe transport|nr:TonB-dependent receptor [Thermoanaerobaculia bacterium]
MLFDKTFRSLAMPMAFAAVMGVSLPAFSQETAPQEPTTVTETIQVTATRTPEDVETVPASVTVISGQELEARGVTDLPSALALATGISVAPGGDTGPAGSVPEIWGLREFDAFLLVVDGVPWGGAFNPALPSVDMTNVERIEVLRGSAPVMYGATSFVGVIHILHRQAGAAGRAGRVWGGNYSSGGAAFSTPLPGSGSFRQSLSVDGERRGFRDDRAGFDRGHVLYRSTLDAAGGSFRFDFDGSIVNQDPASPHVRQGRVLSSLTPLDANYNPSDAKIDENRLHFVTGYDRGLGGGSWSTTLSYTHSERDTVRGFLADLTNTAPNARGFEQDLSIDDVYLDSHIAWRLSPGFQLIAGFDHLYGKATGNAETFSYFVPLSGSNAPSSEGLARDMGFDVEDERNFSGLYAQAEWDPAPRWHFQAGARLNRTDEDREAGEEELGGGEPGGEEEEEEGKQKREVTRGSGAVGVSWLAWGGDANGLWLFADYRNTFKPAAIDFGPEAEADILKPEDAESYELGLKNRLASGRFEWELTGFTMDFDNLVVAQSVNGLPRLVNAGSERFRGVELETKGHILSDFLWQAAYAWHDAKFRDYVQDFDGVPTQLDGNRLELSARRLGSAGLVYAPAQGVTGFVLANYVGERFLNKRNTALAPDYTTWSAGLGYRFNTWEVRLDGENLNDTRPPVAESELGDAQYYRLPARTFRLSLGARF